MSHISTLALHQYRYGELSPERMAEIRAHIDSCDTCRGRLMAQENHRAQFELMPMPAAIKARAAKPPRRAWWWAGLALPVLGAAALLLVPTLMPGVSSNDWMGVALEQAGVKGGGGEAVAGRQSTDGTEGIQAWLATEEPRLVTTADVLRPGDKVQLSYRTDDRATVTLAGRDGRGSVEIYGALQAKADGTWHLAPISLVLDRTPGDQVFFTVYSDAPLDRTELSQALSESRALPDTEVVGMVLPKVVD